MTPGARIRIRTGYLRGRTAIVGGLPPELRVRRGDEPKMHMRVALEGAAEGQPRGCVWVAIDSIEEIA
jgi:hypothetical protein